MLHRVSWQIVTGVSKDYTLFTFRVKVPVADVCCMTLKMKTLHFFKTSVNIYPSS